MCNNSIDLGIGYSTSDTGSDRDSINEALTSAPWKGGNLLFCENVSRSPEVVVATAVLQPGVHPHSQWLRLDEEDSFATDPNKTNIITVAAARATATASATVDPRCDFSVIIRCSSFSY